MTESAENIEPGADPGKKITIVKNGPYIVEGNVRLVRKTQMVSENGEPLTWQTGETLATRERCRLCRCGQSNNKPFCDATHVRLEFVGAESDRAFGSNRVILTGGAHITVRRDYSLCMEAGFCATRFANIEKMLAESEDSRVRSQIIAMIERCPSGSFTYTLDTSAAGVDIEPDLPAQVAVTTEMTSDGPIDGPLWVTGGIPVLGADGRALAVRNRVTLCRCGMSANKPLCDGAHRPH